MSNLNYLPDDTQLIECVTARMAADALRPFGRGGSGYGARMATSYKVKYQNRLYRVYCTCFSNSGSLWIQTKTGKLYLR